MNLYSLKSNNVIGFILFILSFSLSYYLWGLFRKKNKKIAVTKEDKIVSPEFDLAKLLDTSKDKNYLYGKTDKYTWSQNEKEIDLILDLPNSLSISKKDINCTIKSKSVKVVVNGNTILDGNFYSLVDPNECSWQIGLNAYIIIILLLSLILFFNQIKIMINNLFQLICIKKFQLSEINIGNVFF